MAKPASTFSRLNSHLRSLLATRRSESGQTLTEYVVLFSFLVIVCIVSLGLLGAAVLDRWDWITDQLPF